MEKTSDHALVVHVWHLDVLEDLVEAASRLPKGTDQFVTLPENFEPDQRNQVATAFPRARLVEVENCGQDIGALFQLMERVDLTRYEFLCKMHTKKGPNVPHEWRRALLDGILGSEQQVHHIINRFRTDPQVMLAGAKQLFLYGPTYLDLNADTMATKFGGIIRDFDFKTGRWGFIAGTCFWIRTSILLDIAKCSPEFQPADYVTDGAMAHAVERMFGLAVAVRGGTVLLQDLRFSDRLPRTEQGFPLEMSCKKLRMTQILTPLAVNMFIRPRYRRAVLVPPKARRRVAVFASYTSDGILPPQVIPYLEGLQLLTTAIVVVCDNELQPSEIQKLSKLTAHVITGRHGEYDFGSYKRGVAWLRESGLLDAADDLILCNDSCYGPIGSFAPMFAEMEAKNLDLWGATESHEISYHLQSFFVVLSHTAFNSSAFITFMDSIEKQANVQEVIKKYEVGLTQTLIKSGLKPGAMISNDFMGPHNNDPTYRNLTIFPRFTIQKGLPLIKVKSMQVPAMNLNGSDAVLNWVQHKDTKIFNAIRSDLGVIEVSNTSKVSFSIIMPSYNRAWCISRSIDSVLSQTHQNFELIIIDDGSSDNTEEKLKKLFPQELESGKIVYIRLEKNVGVSKARNIGLSYASADWIAYADTDNEMRPYCLKMLAHTILSAPTKDAAYGRMLNTNGGSLIGRPFGHGDIVQGNFIDLGIFTHKRCLINMFGGFDETLRRLVDWDLCIRYTRHKEPAYTDRVILDYADEERTDRISVQESYLKADIQLRRKHSHSPTVSTIIVSYNHQDFIVEAIESALEQKGNFHHEILLSDDGSTDSTRRIVKHYAEKYPNQIRDISRGGNFGISENYRHCFNEAQGEFVAVLEGDDYWSDPEKNLKQAEFLGEHGDVAMVLSRIELFNMAGMSRRLLKRQEDLPMILSAAHFAANEHLNLIVNLSCCMFRSDTMKRLPDTMYDPRLSEIALAFYMDRFGGIGFLSEVMSIYRLNEKSVWSGAAMASKYQQAINVRQAALRVARPIYRSVIQEHIDARQKSLEAELAKSTQTA